VSNTEVTAMGRPPTSTVSHEAVEGSAKGKNGASWRAAWGATVMILLGDVESARRVCQAQLYETLFLKVV
jgi:hypothetical protein